MARTKRELSKAEKELVAAEASYNYAKDKYEKTATDINKQTLAKATEHRKAIKTTVNRERFLRVGNVRVKKTIKAVKSLALIANLRTYTFTKDEADKLCGLLDDAVKKVKADFANVFSGGADDEKETEETIFS